MSTVKNGCHREGGMFFGGLSWYENGERHREDGPAIEWFSGEKQWYLNGKELTEEEFNQWRMKQDLNEKLNTTLAPKPAVKRSKI